MKTEIQIILFAGCKYKERQFLLGIMTHIYNPSIPEAEAGGS
jgi:hypothetical protein